jgi:Flp pilus assembly protein TadD
LRNSLEDFQHAAKINPTSTTLSYLALVEDALGDSKGADRDISAALHHSSPTSIVYSNSAVIKFRRGNRAQALPDAKKALEMDQYNADAYVVISAILKAEGKSNEAQENFNKALQYGHPNSIPPPGW